MEIQEELTSTCVWSWSEAPDLGLNFYLSLSHFTQKWWMQVEGFTLSPWPGFTILKHSLIKF